MLTPGGVHGKEAEGKGKGQGDGKCSQKGSNEQMGKRKREDEEADEDGSLREPFSVDVFRNARFEEILGLGPICFSVEKLSLCERTDETFREVASISLAAPPLVVPPPAQLSQLHEKGD